MEDGLASEIFVTIVDDDESVRESLPDLLNMLGFGARAFASAEEFLESEGIGETGCLLLDVAMPGMSGPDLQRYLMLHGHRIPIVFITARSDEGVREDLLGQGAAACLLKPFSEQALQAALDTALRKA